jgi:hypothetical protein
MRIFISAVVIGLALFWRPAIYAAEPGTAAPQGLNFYTAGPVNGWVVDSATGEPIEGAVVLAYWNFHDANGGVCAGANNLQETLSGKDGSYNIPGFDVRGACNGVDRSDPRLYVFKPGYAFQVLANVNHGDVTPPAIVGQPTGLVGYSDWSNWVIVLPRYPELKIPQRSLRPDMTPHPDPYKTYQGSLTRLNTMLESLIDLTPKQCNWKKMPNMLRALVAQREVFIDQGIPVSTVADGLGQPDKDAAMRRVAPDCGSMHEYMQNLVYSVPPILHPELADRSGKTTCFWPCPASLVGMIEQRVKHAKWKDANGQEKQADTTYYVLVLRSPVSVKAVPIPKGLVSLNSDSYDDVKEVQLAFDTTTLKLDSLLAKPVVVDGYLTPNVDGSLYTAVAEVTTKVSPAVQ